MRPATSDAARIVVARHARPAPRRGEPGALDLQASASATRSSAARRRRRALADDARLGAGEVEHRRRRAGQLARVDRPHRPERGAPAARRRAAADRGRRRGSRSSPTTQPISRDDARRRLRQRRHAHADRLGARAREPGEAPRRVRKDERVRARQKRARDHAGAAAQLGHGTRRACRVRREQRRRLRRGRGPSARRGAPSAPRCARARRGP